MYFDARNDLIAVGTSSIQLCPARARSEIVITNTSAAAQTLTLSFGSQAVNNVGIPLKPFSVYYASNTTGFNVYQGDIYIVSDGAAGQVSIFER
jgi:hypothetical protein